MKAARDNIETMAGPAFAQHVLTDEGHNFWRCGQPDTGHFSFRIFVAPYTVVLFGDLRDLILRHSARDSLGWLVTCSSRDYVLGKATATDGDKREFSWVAAMQSIAEDIREAKATSEESSKIAKLRSIRDDMRDVEDDDWHEQQRAWYEAWATHMELGACDVAECEVWSSTMLWQWHCLRTFVRLWWERDARHAADCDAICAL